ncbi:hypothetical protein [Telmatospirillum siberiense]|uniref:DUF3551 domain-containing protein n=1 Tax=Telmatospirillum siberiense TaxID=382514 RepID=A0A2N3PS46_9PROT|nr:hypothetical protein [Telmatospirillum siberiense]PKU23233.1 hypothetical protein CWS72_17565 [Telmatospirillum siberiense]
MTFRSILFGCALAVLGHVHAEAAPFCVETSGIPLRCLYTDPTSCQQEANRNGGRCAVNPAEFVPPVSALPYCLVEAGGVTSCVFADHATCEREVARRGGACVASTPVPPPGRPPSPGADPYQTKRP